MTVPDETIEQLRPLVQPGRVILIGEVHGTDQYPALVAALTAVAVDRGIEVTVGLELPSSEPPEEFGPFWSAADDGRTSWAMAHLIGELTSIDSVDLVPFDIPYVPVGETIPSDIEHLFTLPRDRVMAELMIEAIDRRPDSFSLVLAGNVHTRAEAPRRRRHKLPIPMGAYITRWYLDALTLKGTTSGGKAWVRTRGAESGGPIRIPADRTQETTWSTTLNAHGHHGFAHVGDVTASPPYRTS